MFRECSGLRVRVGSRVILYINSATILLAKLKSIIRNKSNTILLPTRPQFGHNSVTNAVIILLPNRSQFCYQRGHNSVTNAVIILLPNRPQIGHNSVTNAVTILLPKLKPKYKPLLKPKYKPLLKPKYKPLLKLKYKPLLKNNIEANNLELKKNKIINI